MYLGVLKLSSFFRLSPKMVVAILCKQYKNGGIIEWRLMLSTPKV